MYYYALKIVFSLIFLQRIRLLLSLVIKFGVLHFVFKMIVKKFPKYGNFFNFEVVTVIHRITFNSLIFISRVHAQ